MLECIDRNNKNRREEEIEGAKRNGKYKGRKPIKVDEQLLKQVANAFLNNCISEQEAVNKLGISESRFYCDAVQLGDLCS